MFFKRQSPMPPTPHPTGAMLLAGGKKRLLGRYKQTVLSFAGTRPVDGDKNCGAQTSKTFASSN